MSREEVIKLLMSVQAAYPNFKVQDKTVTVNTWYMMLQNYNYDLAMLALQKYITTDTTGFAPSIGYIVQNIPRNENGELNELEAWALVSKALRNGTYGAEEEFAKLPETVQKAVGSPANLRNWASSDYKAIETVIASNFMRVYTTEVKRADELKRMPETLKMAIEGATNEKNRLGALDD